MKNPRWENILYTKEDGKGSLDVFVVLDKPFLSSVDTRDSYWYNR